VLCASRNGRPLCRRGVAPVEGAGVPRDGFLYEPRRKGSGSEDDSAFQHLADVNGRGALER